MTQINNQKYLIKKIAIVFLIFFVLIHSPMLYRQLKNFGAELYKFSTGGCQSSRINNLVK
jgi:hypothetical protein